MGCDGQELTDAQIRFLFQSTHPHGVRPGGIQNADQAQNFNPRTRMGCDTVNPFPLHLLLDFNPRTRMGCDGFFYVVKFFSHHFNPRTRVGCDKINSLSPIGARNFNPRTRVGCDRVKTDATFTDPNISIHAPGWGATAIQLCHSAAVIYFNPRTRVGCDKALKPEGATLCDFNPRTRVGCDKTAQQATKEAYRISIHAPGWGATKTRNRSKTKI